MISKSFIEFESDFMRIMQEEESQQESRISWSQKEFMMKKVNLAPQIRVFDMNKSMYDNHDDIAQKEELLQILREKPFSDNYIPFDLNEMSQGSEEKGCNCAKSQCIKLYCICFHKGILCTDQCVCTNCSNKQIEDRQMAIEKINEKYGLLNKFGEESFSGCNCKKSRCRKLYCECLIRGKTCTQACKCSRCQNGKFCIHKKISKEKLKKVNSA